MPSPLHLDVLVAPSKPIVGLIPPDERGEATWPATSVSLITGERDAVLVDAALTPETRSTSRNGSERPARTSPRSTSPTGTPITSSA